VTVLLKLYVPSKIDKKMGETLESMSEKFGLHTDMIEDSVRREAEGRRS